MIEEILTKNKKNTCFSCTLYFKLTNSNKTDYKLNYEERNSN